jgi:hypothetical protein
VELLLAERMQVLHVVFEVIELFEGLGTPFDLASVNSVFKLRKQRLETVNLHDCRSGF